MSDAPADLAARFQELAEEVDRTIKEVDRLDPSAREAALTMKAALERFHKVGLTAIVTALKQDPRGKELLFDLVDRPEVRALLSLHGLIRMPDTPAAAPPPTPSSPVIPLASLRARPADGWFQGPAADEILDTRPFRLEVRDTSVVLVRAGSRVQAFRNECAHQGLPIDGGIRDRESGTLTCPWHGFRFDCATGECLTAPHVQLESVPVRVEDGVVFVQVV